MGFSESVTTFKSRSLSESDLERFANVVTKASLTVDRHTFSGGELDMALNAWWVDAVNFDIVDDELFDADISMSRRLPPLFPSIATGPSTNLIWWTDTELPTHQLPNRWAVNDLLTPPQQTHIRPVVRVNGTGGISYRSHSDGVIQRGDISKVAERPALRFPRALEIFETLAKAAGLKIQESSAGQMARLALGHWPNIHALAMDLERIVTRPVLDAYVREFAASELCGNAIGGRRYMSFEDLRRTIDASSGHGVETEIVQSTSEIVDRLLSSSVLRRGFCLKCRQCRSFEFYDLEDVGQTFSCVRCRANNLITSQSGRGGSTEPAWYYELTEVVYQAHRQNFAVPVLALERFTRAHESVLTMSEHRVRGSGVNIEIDLWLSSTGRLLSERQSSLAVSKRLRKMRRILSFATARSPSSLVPTWLSSPPPHTNGETRPKE